MPGGTPIETPSRLPFGTVLGVWAHPDDEAYLSAGLMGLARRRGQRVAVVTATAGEHGMSDPPRQPAELAALRRQELHASLAAVGVTEHTFLTYQDGSCASVPRDDAVDLLASIMHDVAPALTVTFGPDGMTGHPDHRAVSEWTTAAWREAGRPGRLFYATLTPEYHDAWGPVNERIGVWMEGTPPSTPPDQLALALTLDEDLVERKFQALLAQESQTAPLIAALGEQTYRRWWATEYFVEAEQEAGGFTGATSGHR